MNKEKIWRMCAIQSSAKPTKIPLTQELKPLKKKITMPLQNSDN